MFLEREVRGPKAGKAEGGVSALCQGGCKFFDFISIFPTVSLSAFYTTYLCGCLVFDFGFRKSAI